MEGLGGDCRAVGPWFAPNYLRGETGVRWLDVRDLGVEGRGWTNTESYFDRLPASAKGKVPESVWGSATILPAK